MIGRMTEETENQREEEKEEMEGSILDGEGDSDVIWNNETMSDLIRHHLKEWQRKVLNDTDIEGHRCLVDYWLSPPPPGVHCPAVWDRYQCWPATPGNEMAFKKCPIPIIGLPSDAVAYRTCTVDGLWLNGNWTNYSMCVTNINETNVYDDDYYYDSTHDPNAILTAIWVRDCYFTLSIVSCVLLLITLFIFCHFKSLQCPRISIHKNLVLSFILRYILLIILFEPSVLGRTGQWTYRSSDGLCKLLIILIHYSTVANTAWMFVEGLFLHSRVAVSVFKKTMPYKLYFFIGWVLPIPVVISWSICMMLYNEKDCWIGWSQMSYTWIIFAPIVIFLMINLVFLVNIIRIVVTKLRVNGNTAELNNIRKAVRATALLFPLLGLTSILYFNESKPEFVHKFAYRLTNAILQSSQGIFVSIIHCFLNTEVRSAISRRWSQFVIRRVVRKSQRRSSNARSSIFTATTANALSRRELMKLMSIGLEHQQQQQHQQQLQQQLPQTHQPQHQQHQQQRHSIYDFYPSPSPLQAPVRKPSSVAIATAPAAAADRDQSPTTPPIGLNIIITTTQMMMMMTTAGRNS